MRTLSRGAVVGLGCLTSATVFLAYSVNWADARAGASQESSLSVLMMIVDEKEACRPNGYTSYDAGEKSDCVGLTMGDIDYLKERHEVFLEQDIPPQKVSLGDNFLKILDDYKSAKKDNPAARKSIIMVFDWGSPRTMPVSIKREQADSLPTSIPDITWNGQCENEVHWIHHERADAAMISNGVVWTLTAGSESWQFRVAR